MAATFEQLLERSSDDVRHIARELRSVLLNAMPEAVEWVDLADGIAAYGTARRITDIIFAIALHRAHVNLQFADGALLDDPDGIMEGTGKRIRHVKCRTIDDVERPELSDLVARQLDFRRSGER